MCGIAGIIGNLPDLGERVGNMVESLSRRGPDGSGVWLSANARVALGHTRLAIIDTGTGGQQPMISIDGRYSIVFNGEIYNYRELRREIEPHYGAFRGNSDTEVLLAFLAIYGPQCLSRLEGMFAFALWDSQERRLLVARDRLGIKPLLWTFAASAFVFGSDMQTILRSGLLKAELRCEALVDLLSWGWIQQPQTLMEGIRSLEPATFMFVDEAGNVQKHEYWRPLSEFMPPKMRPSFAECTEELKSRLVEAARRHLVSDVPVACFLSGGIDSAVTVAFAQEISARTLATFTLGFDCGEEVPSEWASARLIAQRFGTEHHEIHYMDREIADTFDHFIEVLDQPSHDGLNTYLISKALQGNAKVALSGLGGDELFGGYAHFRVLSEIWESKPPGWANLLAALHRLRPNRLTYRAALAVQPRWRQYQGLRALLNESQTLRAFTPSALDAYLRSVDPKGTDDVWGWPEIQDPINQISAREIRGYLLNTLLRDTDAVSMGNGVEIRPMLLDNGLLDFALNVPGVHKIHGQLGKAVLIEASRLRVPPEILSARKLGFEVPFSAWLYGKLFDRFRTLCHGKYATALFRRSFLETIQRPAKTRRQARVAWTVCVLLAELEKYKPELSMAQ